MPKSKLTPKQARFVDEYIIDLNATQAAIRAGYAARSADVTGARLLGNARLQAALQKAQARLARKIEVTQERIVDELRKIGFSDMSRFARWGPRGVELKSSDELDADSAACVSEVSETDNGSVKFKLHDKVAALNLLAKHLGMLKEKVELTGKDGGPLVPPALTVVIEAQPDGTETAPKAG